MSITLNKRDCLQCGGSFESSSRTKKTCSDDCKRRYQSALKLVGRKSYDCKQCGKSFHAKDKRFATFCSKRCSGAHKRERTAKRNQLRREQTHAPRPCRICNTVFLPTTSATTLCGKECQMEQARRLATKSAQLHDKRNRAMRPCRECSLDFAPEYGNLRRLFCSQACLERRNSRVNKATRRARSRGNEHQPIDPFDIFERDNWRCHMCRVRTPRSLRGTHHGNAPELDHILPLAAGGTHTQDNVACACRKCNQNKGAKPMGQIRLTFLTVPKGTALESST